MNKIELLELLKETCEKELEAKKTIQDKNCYMAGYCDGIFDFCTNLFNQINVGTK